MLRSEFSQQGDTGSYCPAGKKTKHTASQIGILGTILGRTATMGALGVGS